MREIATLIDGVVNKGGEKVLSTAEAISTCAVSEHHFLSSLGVDSRFISGVRYVDDLTGRSTFAFLYSTVSGCTVSYLVSHISFVE